jgi:hypothetical protein
MLIEEQGESSAHPPVQGGFRGKDLERWVAFQQVLHF